MAAEISKRSASNTTIIPGQPSEQLEVEEAAQPDNDIVYPTGLKLWLTLLAVGTGMILTGLDLLIVAVTVPSLTDEWNTLADIGWYSSIYGIIGSAFIFFCAKLYTVFTIKSVFMVSLAVFECGSLLCTFSYSSKQFIFGRALAGLGSTGLGGGAWTIITYSFPLQKRPLWTGILMTGSSVAMVSAPVIGGALIDAFSWRACFGINLPLGIMVFVLIAFCFKNPATKNPDIELPFVEKLKKLDLLSTFIMVPSITCLMIAMQWGGIRYGWGSAPIIILLVLFGVFLAIFCYLQRRLQDKAVLPPRILKMRSILAAAWFTACCNGVLAVTEYFISIYFQGVKGYSAGKAGYLGVPMVVGLTIAAVAGSMATSFIGYYTPLMLATTLLAPIAMGLLTTIEIDDSLVKVIALLGFLGAAIGVGMSGPMTAVQATLPAKEVVIGMAITGFGGGMGSALFLSASSALFQNRLIEEIQKYSPGTNSTRLESVGLADIRRIVGPARLKNVLLGYDEAITQTFYLPLALTVATVIGSGLSDFIQVKYHKDQASDKDYSHEGLGFIFS